jgi:ABC-type multidrug transport system fused ATPase/permease subunit
LIPLLEPPSHASTVLPSSLFLCLQDISYFDGVATGELTSRLSSDTAAMTSPMQTVLSATLSNILMLLGGFVMCLITSWRLTVLAMTYERHKTTALHVTFARAILEPSRELIVSLCQKI